MAKNVITFVSVFFCYFSLLFIIYHVIGEQRFAKIKSQLFPTRLARAVRPVYPLILPCTPRHLTEYTDYSLTHCRIWGNERSSLAFPSGPEQLYVIKHLTKKFSLRTTDSKEYGLANTLRIAVSNAMTGMWAAQPYLSVDCGQTVIIDWMRHHCLFCR